MKTPKCPFCRISKEKFICPETGKEKFRWVHEPLSPHPPTWPIDSNYGMIPYSEDEIYGTNDDTSHGIVYK